MWFWSSWLSFPSGRDPTAVSWKCLFSLSAVSALGLRPRPVSGFWAWWGSGCCWAGVLWDMSVQVTLCVQSACGSQDV